LNFEFIGFGITGSVLSKGADSSGPIGMSINLLTSDETNVIATAMTDTDGKYDFFGVTPGDYIVQVEKDSANTLALDATSRKIHVGEDVGVVEPFNILGYSIEGQVIGINQEPLEGIEFKLLEAESKTVISTAKSDKTGSIKFMKVPVGHYLVELNDNLKESIELVMNSQTVEVGHDNAHLTDFQVKSFSMFGSVKAGSKPLGNVKINVENVENSKEDMITNSDGSFVLKGVSKAPVVLKAMLDGYDFDPIVIDKVEPNMELAVVQPTRFRLAGKVDRAGFSQEITVKFKDDKEDTIGKVSVTEKGLFSIYLPAAEYTVSVEVSATEQAKIGFAPLENRAIVSDSPIGDLNFHAIKADIEGRVQCLAEDCGSILEVSLMLDERILKKTLVSAENGAYKFTGVLPNTYTLSISDDGKCWKEPVKKVSVSEDVKNVDFQQVGHFISVSSTRKTLMLIEGAKSKELQEVVIAKGNNIICVKSMDNEVKFKTQGCEEFEISPSDTLNLKSLEKNSKINLKAVKYSVSGRVNSKESKISDLKVIAKSETRLVELELEPLENDVGYSFDLMAYPGEEVVFQPISAGHLFEPESLHVFVDHDCHTDVATFTATKGHFVQGKITPPVEGVKIKITNAVPNQKIVGTLTDESGKYSLGPLPQFDYKVEASKQGYVFEETSDGFKSNKLASILVEVEDVDGSKLDGVVISVSGGRFRSNTKSEAGKAEFLSLSPDEYFIKPQLKEYEFNPKHKMQKLQQGENAHITWTAKRVAFSIHGKIVSLNGQAEPGTTLKATSKNCGDISEEATSESDGSFRFRGLKPKCNYVITFLSGESIEKIIPSQVEVTMTEADFKLDNRIVAMRAFETMDTLLKITDEIKQLSPTNLKISVSSPDSNYNFVTKAVTGQLVTLPRIPKDNKRYDVNVETIPAKFAPQKKVSHSYVADDYVKSIKLVLNKTAITQRPNKQVSSLVYLLPLIIGGVLIFLLWDQRPQFIKSWMDPAIITSQAANRRASDDNSTGAVNDGWEVSATPTGAKRRNKKR